ncbi:MAG TPA: protein kinase [Candidatus Angelobacter sp.]
MERGTQIGAYQVLELLGAGGMARVYLAQDSRLGRKVALKVLPIDAVQNPDRVRRFEQEARAASALNHPNILTIYEIGDVDSTKYIATEFVEGVTLASLIAGRMALGRALDIALQAAAALSTAHAAGIVHRDIKPENIMVRPDGLVKILDFGLAKLSQTGLDSLHGQQTLDVTMPGMVMGTLAYMSPEQLRGQEVDARTDVWSLGVVLYHMITGTDPVTAPTATDIMVAILERTPTPLRQLRREAPEELERIVSKMLAKDRDDRYQTMKDVAIDLRRLKQRVEAEQGASEPAFAASTGTPSPVRKPAGRIALLLGAVVILALLFLGGALWLRSRPSAEPSSSAQRATLPEPPAPSAPPKSSPAQSATNTITVPGAGPIAVPAVPDVGLTAAGGERQLSYYFMYQQWRNGKPVGPKIRTMGKDPLEKGWKFTFIVSSPQAGSLYLIDQAESGTPSVLFPLPQVNRGKSTIPGGKAMEIGPYIPGDTPGNDKLWIIWSATPVLELQTATSLLSNSQFARAAATQVVQKWLQQHQSAAKSVTTQASAKEVKMVSQSDPLVAAVELEHR